MLRTPPSTRAAKEQAKERIADTFNINRRKKQAESVTSERVLVSPFPLRKTRSEMDNQSTKTNLSRSSLAKIEALEANRLERKEAFKKLILQQQEIDKLELTIVEMKRKQLSPTAEGRRIFNGARKDRESDSRNRDKRPK